jgi:hypothetical protein
MNILEQTEALKDLPDAALIQQMKMPTGQIAPIFITSELKRRKRMRDDYARREAADTPTVAEEVVMAAGMPQGGIADAARALAPKTDMGQNTGMGDMMPRAATQAPQPMASGGIVGMRQGGKLVKVGRASFYAFPDGEVFVENPDGSREAVTDPRVLGVVRAQANVGPERQESAAPLGSEILQEAAPQRPTLDSTLSSDRPFSPLSTEVDDTRPAVPSDYGMGGERPSTLTDATQPAFNQEQALLDAMSPAFDRFGGDPLARAIRDQQEQGIASLNPPSAPAVEATPDTLPEMEKAGDFDPFAPLGQERAARAVLAQQAPDNAKAEEELTKFLKSQEMAGGRPGGTTIEDTRMMNMLNAQRQAEEVANLEALRKTQPNVDVGTDPRFGDTMGLQEVLAGDFDPVSDASSKPATPYVPFIPIEPRVGERSIGVGDTFSRAAAAREQGLDMPNPMPPTSTDLRGDPGQYGFPQKENIAMGESIAELDKQLKELPSELSNVPTDLDLADVTSKALQEASFDMPSSLTQPIPSGTEADPVVLSEEEAVGIETARPKAAPAALKAERDAAKLFAPDGGGITTVSTKAINDAAKQSKGLSTDAWLAIAQGGAAMAASKNPTLLGAFGEGAGVAAAGLQKQRAAEKTAGLEQAKIDATLQAARIRAAAAGQRGMAPPTGSALLTYLSTQLDQAKFDRKAAENDRGKGRAAEIVRLDREIAELQARIAGLSPVLAASVGGTQAKDIDLSKG